RCIGILHIAWVVLLAAATSVGAHEHMPIASTEAGGGALLLVYDFSRLSVVEPAPTGQITGNDPGFNALLADDPANGHYRLKDGTKVNVVLVARDPAATMAVNAKVLENPGDKTAIGTMPYLHVDVAWTLTPPPGGSGYYQVSFRITAA